MSATSQYLLEGSYYALVQCGKLLTSAAILYNAGDCATAVALAAFAWEELGRSRYLRDQRKKVVAGKTVLIEEIRATCEKHTRKQEWGQIRVVHKPSGKTAFAKQIRGLLNQDLQSTEYQEARQQLDDLTKRKKARTPHDRHVERMRSLYVEPNGLGSDWNKPWEKDKPQAKEFIEDAIGDYLRQVQNAWALNLLRRDDPELAQAVEALGARPVIPPPPRLT